MRHIGVLAEMAALRSGRSRTCEFNGVRKKPGAIALTRILYLAHSLAKLSVSILTPALLHEYGATSVKLTKLVSEQVLMIQPRCCLIIWRPKIWLARKLPFRLISMIRVQSSSQKSPVGNFFSRPGVHTRI